MWLKSVTSRRGFLRAPKVKVAPPFAKEKHKCRKFLNLHNCEHTGSVLCCVCLKERATRLGLKAVLAARRKPWTNMADKNGVCSAGDHVIYENCTNIDGLLRRSPNINESEVSGEVTQHVVSTWSSHDINIRYQFQPMALLISLSLCTRWSRSSSSPEIIQTC